MQASMTQITDKQAEAIRLAQDRGYFEIPRQIGLGDLADELGVSTQAASERLRRGLAQLARHGTVGGTSNDELRCVACERPVSLMRADGVGHMTCQCVRDGDIEAVRASEMAVLPDRWLFLERGDDDGE